MVNNDSNGTLGDLYSTNICISFALGNVNVLHATSILLAIIVHVRDGCMHLETQIIVPPLLL